MKTTLSRLVIPMFRFIGLGCVADGRQPKSQANVNPDAQLLQDFRPESRSTWICTKDSREGIASAKRNHRPSED